MLTPSSFSRALMNRTPRAISPGDGARCSTRQKAGVCYRKFTEVKGTSAPRNKVFEWASGSHVLCLDSHVLLAPGAVARLRKMYRHTRDWAVVVDP